MNVRQVMGLALMTTLSASAWAAPTKAECGTLVDLLEGSDKYKFKNECLAYATRSESLCDSSAHPDVCRALHKVAGTKSSGACSAFRTDDLEDATSIHSHTATENYAWCVAMATGTCDGSGLDRLDLKACPVFWPPLITAIPEPPSRPHIALPADDMRSVSSPKAPDPRRYEDVSAEKIGVLYAATVASRRPWEELVDGWADALGGRPLHRPGTGMKGMDRSIDKASSGGDTGVETQRDTLGSTIEFADLTAMAAGVAALERTVAGDGGEVVRFKNRMRNPYLRDFLVNIRMPSGLVTELQIHVADVLAVKMGEGKERVARDSAGHALDSKRVMGLRKLHTHDVYDYRRDLDAFAGELAGLAGRAEDVRKASIDAASATDDRTRALAKAESVMHLKVAALTREVETLMGDLEALNFGLMDEVWTGALVGHEAAYVALAAEDIRPGDDRQHLDVLDMISLDDIAEQEERATQYLTSVTSSTAPGALTAQVSSTLLRYADTFDARIRATRAEMLKRAGYSDRTEREELLNRGAKAFVSKTTKLAGDLRKLGTELAASL